MSRFALLTLVLLSTAAAAPLDSVDDIDPQKLCKACPMLVNLFLNNKNVEEKVFDKLCSKILKTDDSNPMVKVCEAGLMGEMEYIKQELGESGATPAQICQKLRICPAH
ncbi:hypothetical protein PMAYCL1PPCAC_24378 [Pristionchus mayeri]|uniref:Saposin B-type domain-containing protein n=1 Tax=Pristionchus mayeri TaxID=1317129 RepID=A0AAN5D007_9BILA|nr:hypothetical protein PMAYCL1PPCAC_24378 [Pristionchus mayeri]